MGWMRFNVQCRIRRGLMAALCLGFAVLAMGGLVQLHGALSDRHREPLVAALAGPVSEGVVRYRNIRGAAVPGRWTVEGIAAKFRGVELRADWLRLVVRGTDSEGSVQTVQLRIRGLKIDLTDLLRAPDGGLLGAADTVIGDQAALALLGLGLHRLEGEIDVTASYLPDQQALQVRFAAEASSVVKLQGRVGFDGLSPVELLALLENLATASPVEGFVGHTLPDILFDRLKDYQVELMDHGLSGRLKRRKRYWDGIGGRSPALEHTEGLLAGAAKLPSGVAEPLLALIGSEGAGAGNRFAVQSPRETEYPDGGRRLAEAIPGITHGPLPSAPFREQHMVVAVHSLENP